MDTTEETRAPEAAAAPQAPPQNGETRRDLTIRRISEERELVPAPPAGMGSSTWGLLPHAATLARMIAGTNFVPAMFRNRPDSVAAATLLGHELGVGPMMALRQLYVTDVTTYTDQQGRLREKGGEILMAAQLMRAVARKSGAKLWPTEYTSLRVTWTGHARGEPDHQIAVTWTLDDARRAKLIRQGSAWEKTPRAMLSARASSELCRLIAEDALAGIYSVEEFRDDPRVVEAMRVLDPDEVAEAAAQADEPAADAPDTAGTTRRASPRRAKAAADTPAPAPVPSARDGGAPAPVPSVVASSVATWQGLEVPGDDPKGGDAHAAEAAPRDAPTAVDEPSDPASAADVQRFVIACRDAGVDRHAYVRWLTQGRTESSKELTVDECLTALDWLRATARGEVEWNPEDGHVLLDHVALCARIYDDMVTIEGAGKEAKQQLLAAIGSDAVSGIKAAGGIGRWLESVDEPKLRELRAITRRAAAGAAEQEVKG